MDKILDFRSYCDKMKIDYYKVTKDKKEYEILYDVYKKYCYDNNYICEKKFNMNR